MNSNPENTRARDPLSVFHSEKNPALSIPILMATDSPSALKWKDKLSEAHLNWLETIEFTPKEGNQALLPASDGSIAAVVLGLGDGLAGDPCGPSELLIGQLAASLPAGKYRLAEETAASELAAVAWGLGAYRFDRYRSANGKRPARLKMPSAAGAARVLNTIEAVWLARDMINTPASDFGPEELEAAARLLARKHGAQVSVIAGDDLLQKNFPLIHAVGRASSRAPRLIDLTWRNEGAGGALAKITLIGKGVCFDTGGLDLKAAAGMLLMKKDMGGAATALALAHMVMGQRLNADLRVLIPAVENSVAGNAFRPGDILVSRAGKSVEIANTDAEGRLILADALALADEEEPNTLITFATLTGSARVALGPDLPALFCTDDTFAAAILEAGTSCGDPLWRMPLWRGYDRQLESSVADFSNVAQSTFAGAVSAALFLKRFTNKARRFAHIDLYGWRPAPRPLGPAGGEPHAARAVFAALHQELAV